MLAKCKTLQQYLPAHLKEVCLRDADGDIKSLKKELIKKGKDQEEKLLSNIVYIRGNQKVLTYILLELIIHN